MEKLLFTMQDYRCEGPEAWEDESPLDVRSWNVEVEAGIFELRIKAKCPDGTERLIWVEIAGEKLVVHAYDPQHEEPVNVHIGKDKIDIDHNRPAGAGPWFDGRRI